MVITQKVSVNLPGAYVAIIDFDIVEGKKAKDRTAFIKRAIEDEFKLMNIKLVPRDEKKMREQMRGF